MYEFPKWRRMRGIGLKSVSIRWGTCQRETVSHIRPFCVTFKIRRLQVGLRENACGYLFEGMTLEESVLRPDVTTNILTPLCVGSFN